jgi:hypothetical protein
VRHPAIRKKKRISEITAEGVRLHFAEVGLDGPNGFGFIMARRRVVALLCFV